ncbi:hypothetical protein [Micromonospora echinofusca]|uniref:Activator of Hsp90 ATPase homolog 1-like protein n=1 Tax=Micromonospora echinofusca TaxID=47858 RepID=A0ABS3VLU4_MICEH|nr:hypothetical protein [Micromonospora echinofusca]MBO4205510.1 hypothetical protein [Micromonospora echinofusca]
MGVHAERGMSAPPEVVFNTATDPDRAAAWLPPTLRADGQCRPERSDGEMRAVWTSSAAPDWSAELVVHPENAGGSRVRLALDAGPERRHLDGLADETLDSLAREVAENLTAG